MELMCLAQRHMTHLCFFFFFFFFFFFLKKKKKKKKKKASIDEWVKADDQLLVYYIVNLHLSLLRKNTPIFSRLGYIDNGQPHLLVKYCQLYHFVVWFGYG